MKNNFLIILSAATAIIVIVFSFFMGRPQKAEVDEAADKLTSCQTIDYSGIFDFNEKVAVFEGQELGVPGIALSENTDTRVLSSTSGERWIEIDLSEQKLKAWEGGNLFLETLVSTGLPHTPTPKGEFRIWIKLRATKMEGGRGRYYYYLPNVPYVMYFENSQVPGYKGYGLHGTYWHDAFGTQRSHGCVNLPTPMAEKLYHWVNPVLPQGTTVVRANSDNLGTRIVIHD